jgi:integrase
MTEIDPILENWLSIIAYSHSNSLNTRIGYLHSFQIFLDHAGKTTKQILEDYERMDDKQFKRYYTPLIMSLIVKLQREGYSPSSQQYSINTIRSFFKYNNLPLNYLPTGKKFVVFHNRDITKEEIEEIIKQAEPREQAFYALMTQSGLRPNELCNIKIRNVEKIIDKETPIPCLIKIEQDEAKGEYSPYFTFIGKEGVYYLKEYLKRRVQPLNQDEYLFTKEDSKTQIDTDLISHMFRRTVIKLKDQKVLNFENKKSKLTNRNELRLYNLRKYFRNHTNAGDTFTNFWMGHSLGVDDHYFSKDVETHKKQYEKTAMKNLRIETKTPDQNEDIMKKLEQENKELKDRLKIIENKLFPEPQDRPEGTYLTDEQEEQLEEQIKIQNKWEEKHPEEVKKQEEEQRKSYEEFLKYREEHPEIEQQEEENYREYIESELRALQKKMAELYTLLSKDSKTEK